MKIDHIYLIGIGGIGMSAIARYFLHEGKQVGGYDRTRTALTERLEKEGADIHYEDCCESIAEPFRDPTSTLVIYTPAVPADHSELNWFRQNGFEVVKRAQALGHLSEGKYVMAIAGTHGKTTTTTLTAWLNHEAGDGGSAFLGGISKNFDSNLVLGPGKRLAVEADEFDRSFLQLRPDAAVITSADADHLDIYGTHEALKEAFSQFVDRIKPGGTLIIKQGVDVKIKNRDISVYRYALNDGHADFRAMNTRIEQDGCYSFDIVCPDRMIRDCRLGVPGIVNVENAIAAVALLWVAGFDEIRLRQALSSFKGVKRRFDFYINTSELIYMDDYAHHPQELRATIESLRGMFPGRKLTVVFQPHLYTRTRDFYREFAEALSLADEVLLVPIYPAREAPIEGINSELIGSLLTVPHRIVPKEKIAAELANADTDIVVSFGAGDIDNCCEEIARRLRAKLSDKR